MTSHDTPTTAGQPAAPATDSPRRGYVCDACQRVFLRLADWHAHPCTTQDPPEPPAPEPARPPRQRRTRSRRSGIGSTRRLPSGRWQARYHDHDGTRRSAPHTFDTRAQAEDWIATNRADLLRGTWHNPDLGAATLATYATDWLAMRVDLAPRTRAGYQSMITGWLTADLPHPLGGRRSPVNLGTVALRDLTAGLVREWHAAALLEAHGRAVRRAQASDRHRRLRAVHSARQWARERGIPVKPTGRLPAAVLDAWTASGAPQAAALDLPATDPGRDAGRVQVVHAYRLLRAVLATAHRDGLIPANPCTIRGAGQVRAAERVPASPSEVAQIAAHMPAHLAAAVQVAAWSGLRAGELFALSRSRVDLTAGTLRVDRALVCVPGEPVRFGPPKTTASIRTVHLPRPVADLLAEHMATFAGPGPEALVFTHTNGTPVTAARRTGPFRAACAQVGRDDLRWHDLRHTGATMAAQAGASLRELQARLGHSTVAAAMTYQHATTERDKALADRLAGLVITPTDPEPSTPRLRIAQ